jgi:hypothetical protein
LLRLKFVTGVPLVVIASSVRRPAVTAYPEGSLA